jgi:type I restriction enzyme, S subunit
MAKYLVVETGDIVFNKLRTWQGGLGASAYNGIVSPAYFVCRPMSGFSSRFLQYLLLSSPYLQELTRVSKWQPPSQFDITWDQLRQIQVVAPELIAQQAIADYLDAETARIDALIEKKQRMIGLIAEQFWSRIAAQIQDFAAPKVPMRRYLTDIRDGPFGSSLTSNHYADQGARVVRLGNIGFAEFKNEDQAFIATAHYVTLLRHRVSKGDLLIAGLGDSRNHVGRACVAPELGPAIVKADCYRARIDPKLARTEYLAIFLSSPLGAQEVGLATRGSTRSRINLDIAKDILIPLVSLDEQDFMIALFNVRRGQMRRMTEILESQMSLLAERRQAVITGAVTGELNIEGDAA